MDYVIGIGDYAISQTRGDCLKTYALASCVALTVYHPMLKAAGMIHMALPSPNNDLEARARPAYYVTTGIPLLLNLFQKEYGGSVKELVIKLFGGAYSVNEDDYFRIGMKNVSIAHQILAERHIPMMFEETGGYISRSLIMATEKGDVKVIAYPITI
ncbi:chemotaxis protein [Desulfosporosinus acidiphilus SJ4]|uniref:Chemotaxis protein n=1 Tax=Desulfosporosinus acidiphilus (strain DSM 22704 / JCM 16185 / SJ4) TaxID=646529 RepID=I4D273_DESAJ|nr:chemotaxis protein CheD [Desulfosporosinus acidiphilus]AFM39897.1 chemotaxis protein [Desulfosporosinus acidiphilus SJ4]